MEAYNGQSIRQSIIQALLQLLIPLLLPLLLALGGLGGLAILFCYKVLGHSFLATSFPQLKVRHRHNPQVLGANGIHVSPLAVPHLTEGEIAARLIEMTARCMWI